MSAMIIIMPIVMRPAFADPAWREQRDREREQLRDIHLRGNAPPRTRPIPLDLRKLKTSGAVR